MRTSLGRATPLSGWPTRLSCVLAFSSFLLPFEPALAAGNGPAVDAHTLLTLGINLGIIAFAVGTAIACLRATERAKKAQAAAEREAESYHASEGLLDTPKRVAKAYEDHLRAVANMLRQRAYFDVLDVRYEAVVDRPLEQARRLARFIGTPLDVPGMAAVVRRELYRNRR